MINLTCLLEGGYCLFCSYGYAFRVVYLAGKNWPARTGRSTIDNEVYEQSAVPPLL